MHISLFRNPIFWSLFITVCYLTYLSVTSQILISTDAHAYEWLGTLLHEGKFQEYMATGPNREPVYPLMVSMAMHIADYAKVSYLTVMKLLQISLLVLTQFLTWQMMKKFGITRGIAAAVILYLGISPAMVNSAFSLFSEIGTYPLVLAVVWVSAICMEKLFSGEFGHGVFWSLCFSLLLVALTLSKAIYAYIFYFYLVIFVAVAVRCAIKQEWKKAANFILFLTILIFTFSISIAYYKSLNFQYNNHYAITDRGQMAVYGCAVKRTSEITPSRFLAALSWVPGEMVCRRFFSEADCYHWGYLNTDRIGFAQLAKLEEQGFTGTAQYQKIIEQAKEEIFRNPWQYIFFTAAESLKIFFWESTKIGFVEYPPWLTKVFASTPLNYLLRSVTALVTLIAFVYFLWKFWMNRADLLSSDGLVRQRAWLGYFLIQFVFLYTAFYSLATIVIRYIFPIVPLFLIMIAVAWSDALRKKERIMNVQYAVA